jgi:hypothetical protein
MSQSHVDREACHWLQLSLLSPDSGDKYQDDDLFITVALFHIPFNLSFTNQDIML